MAELAAPAPSPMVRAPVAMASRPAVLLRRMVPALTEVVPVKVLAMVPSIIMTPAPVLIILPDAAIFPDKWMLEVSEALVLAWKVTVLVTRLKVLLSLNHRPELLALIV